MIYLNIFIGDEKMANLKKIELCKGANFSVVKDDRFKTSRISVLFFVPLEEDTASANFMLMKMLRCSCRKYPDFSKLERHLNKLYGASLQYGVQKMGEVQALSVTLVGIDDKYVIDDTNISDELTRLMCDVIFDPDLDNGTFRKENLKQEKRQAIELIESEYNDRRSYSKLRCEQIMCENEKFSIRSYGTIERVRKLDVDDIYIAWENLLKRARIEVTVFGNYEWGKIYDRLKRSFDNIDRGNIYECETEIIQIPNEIKKYTERINVSQSKLVLGFRAGDDLRKRKYMAMEIMVSLWGGTPHSKLFLNVREKMSLCYYCSAKYDRYKSVVFVESGVEKENIERAQGEILNQLKDIQAGNFTDDEINQTKMSAINNIITSTDYLSGLENWYVSQIFDKKILSQEQVIAQIKQISKQDIIDASNKISLDTVYILTSNGEEK